VVPNLGSEIQRARGELNHWLAGSVPNFRLPEGKAGLAAVRVLGQWVLDYANDGTDAGFPFDRPWLDLYLRRLRSCRTGTGTTCFAPNERTKRTSPDFSPTHSLRALSAEPRNRL
jgi:hypothetical protein